MAKRLREFLNRAPGEAPRRNASPMALLKGKNEQLMRPNLDLSERLAAADSAGSLFNLRLSSADEIADVICRDAAEDRISRHKAEAIAKGVLARAKNKKKTQRPAG